MSQTEIIQNFNDVSGRNVRLSVNQEPLNYGSSSLVSSYLEEYNQLSDLEKMVLTIAKTVLKKKKFASEISANRVESVSPLIGQLYSKCIAKLHYAKDVPKEEIFKTIQDLIKKKWIVSGQRRTRQEIIENPLFKRILKFIERHPGTFSRDPAIEKEMNITRSPFLKHIRVLESFNLVRKKKSGKTTNIFLNKFTNSYDELVVLFSNPNIVKTLKFIASMDEINLSEIARQLDVVHGTVNYYIKKMTSHNVLIRKTNQIMINSELLNQYNQTYQSPAFYM